MIMATLKHKLQSAIGLGVSLVLAGCASTQAAKESLPTFAGALMEERGITKKLILRFTPETPQYNVVHNKDNTLSEVRWKANSPQNFQKEFVFTTEKGKGVKKALVIMDARTGVGTLTLWHDASDSFTFARQNTNDLALVPDDPFRKSASTGPRAKKVSLNVRGAPLDKVIRSLAAESNKSLVLPSNVSGTVTVSLDGLSYEQAIDLVLRPTAYRAEHMGDVTIVRTANEARTYRSFKIRYVDISEILPRIRDIAGKDAQISIDPNSNSLFMIDRYEYLKNVEAMLAQIDVEPRIVEVESAILQVDRSDALDYGIDWSGTIKNGTTEASQVINNVKTNALSPVNPKNANQKGLFFGLTWQSVTGVISALSSKSRTDLLARPRVLSLTDQEASVTLGQRLGFKTTTVSATGAAENVQFLTVGTILKIKPHITGNNDILMYVKPEVSDGTIDAVTNAPNSTTTTAESKILARNGQTIVIAGLMKDRTEKKTDRIPVLGDLPLLGSLFGGTSDRYQKTEIVVLMSPKVVTNELKENYDRQGNDALGRFYDEAGIPISVPIGHINVKE